MEIFANGDWLPLVFALLVALVVLIYSILDGYDVGVGILMNNASEKDQNIMISSIGPFWDANETWLVLAVGLLFIAFPQAYGLVMTKLYLPVFVLLISIILRGISFDFRSKAKAKYKKCWTKLFIMGSLLMSMSQGYMLGSYALGFKMGLYPQMFYFLTGASVSASYALIGSSWLVMKTEGALQLKAIKWGRNSLCAVMLFFVSIAVFAPFMNSYLIERWTELPNIFYMFFVPVFMLYLIYKLRKSFKNLGSRQHVGCWKPFLMTCLLFVLSMIVMAYSFYPYIVPNHFKILDIASADNSLMFVLIGALIMFPLLIGYTFFAYKVFHGKTSELTYN